MPDRVELLDVWRDASARRFFENVWPMYVHELCGFDTDFYRLDATGRWLPDTLSDWLAPVTPADNLCKDVEPTDARHPVQRAHVITWQGRAVGFACVARQPFAYMPEDVDVTLAEFFLTRAARGAGVGRQAVERLLARYPGSWCLRAIHDNDRAIRFWRSTLSSPSVGALREELGPGDVAWRFTTLAEP